MNTDLRTPQQDFTSVLNTLNSRQRQAVELIDGPVMVVAGPGTGKTQVLATRIANILHKTDTSPRSILALTFTESAAAHMRRRLVGLVGSAGYQVSVTTFHAFCSQVIQEHPEYFQLDRGSQPLSDVERYQLFEELISDADIETLKPLNSPLFYVREVISAISHLKREGYDPDTFQKLVDKELQSFSTQADELSKTERQRIQKNINKWQDLTLLFSQYQNKLLKRNRYDYDDMVSFVVAAFRQHQDLLLDYQEQFQYFLVDEYQDTNTAQNTVVELLAAFWGQQANIFVVGDPHQSIFRFQGASLSNTLHFLEMYPDAEVITLDLGYRCPQPIYTAAHALIQSSGQEVADFPLSDRVKETFSQALSQEITRAHVVEETTIQKSPLSIIRVNSELHQLLFLAEEVQKLIDKGTHPNQIAVLYRNNREGAQLQEIFEAYQVPFHLESGSDALRHQLAVQLLQVIRAVVALQDGQEIENMYAVLQSPWFEIPPVLVDKITWVASHSKMTIQEVIAGGLDHANAFLKQQQILPIEFSSVEKILMDLHELAAADAQEVFPSFFEQLLSKLGVLNWILEQPNHTQLLMVATTLFSYTKDMAYQNHQLSARDVVSSIELLLSYGVVLPIDDYGSRENSVSLSTVHKAKGREWKYVFLMNGVDDVWGNARTRQLLPLPESVISNSDGSKHEKTQDDRRLLYVAVTRARKQFSLIVPEYSISNGRQKELVPSMFIGELESNNSNQLNHLKAEADDEKLNLQLATVLGLETPEESERQTKMHSQRRAFFADLVQNFTLSVTALNTYLRDPQEFVDNVLLRVPRAKPESMAFGTAIHSALELIGNSLIETQSLPPLSKVHQRYHQALQRELLSSSDFARRLEHGKNVLETFLEEHSFDSAQVLFTERFFGFKNKPLYLDDVPLSGRIDRVDWIDRDAKTVRVIDYKTGKPKSVNYIEGTLASLQLSDRERALPETIRGPYKRQLLFYKLLTDLDQTFLPQVKRASFAFVEPLKSGSIVERDFSLESADVELLKELIAEVMTEIRQLKFLD